MLAAFDLLAHQPKDPNSGLVSGTAYCQYCILHDRIRSESLQMSEMASKSCEESWPVSQSCKHGLTHAFPKSVPPPPSPSLSPHSSGGCPQDQPSLSIQHSADAPSSGHSRADQLCNGQSEPQLAHHCMSKNGMWIRLQKSS